MSHVPVSAVTGDSRRTMRRRVGAKLGDFVLLTATANGSTTTFTDAIRLRSSARYEGRTALFASGANDGLERFVSGSSSTTLTVATLTAATVIGDSCELWNERTKGWTPTEVNDALDTAIADAAAIGGVEVAASITPLFNKSTAVIDIPTTLTHVYAVEYRDDDGFWKRVPRASGAGRGGYWLRGIDGDVEVQGDWRETLNGRTVRLLGYGQPSPLTSDAGLVGCNSTWLLLATCALLMESGAHKAPGEDRERWALQYGQQAFQMRPAAVKIRKPGSEAVHG